MKVYLTTFLDADRKPTLFVETEKEITLGQLKTRVSEKAAATIVEENKYNGAFCFLSEITVDVFEVPEESFNTMYKGKVEHMIAECKYVWFWNYRAFTGVYWVDGEKLTQIKDRTAEVPF